MAYKDRFGVTKIRTGQRDQLSISYDYDTVMIRDWFVAYCDDPERLPLDRDP